MTPPSQAARGPGAQAPDGTTTPALAAAQRHLAASQAALSAAMRGETPGQAPGAAANAAGLGAPAGVSLLALLADRSLAPWAERRPWALVGLAAAAGALLASRRGRGLVSAVVMTALLAPPPGRLSARAIGHGLGLVLRRPAKPPQ
jgi:hypothetical protein